MRKVPMRARIQVQEVKYSQGPGLSLVSVVSAAFAAFVVVPSLSVGR